MVIFFIVFFPTLDRLWNTNRHDRCPELVVCEKDRRVLAPDEECHFTVPDALQCLQQIARIEADVTSWLPSATLDQPLHAPVLCRLQPHPYASRQASQRNAERLLRCTGQAGLECGSEWCSGDGDRGALLRSLQQREIVRKLSLDEPCP